MPFTFNPFTGNLDETSTGGGGGGSVVGPGSSVVGDIATWGDTTGTTLADSGVAFPIPVPSGGTGLMTIASHGVMMGSGTGNVSTSTAGTAGMVFTSGGASADGAYAAIGTNSGLQAHGVVIAEGSGSFAATTPGTTGLVLIGTTGADPSFGALGVNSNLTGIIYGNTNSAFTGLGAATNGQIPIGNSGNPPTLATITAGTNIVITNAAGSITIAAGTAGTIRKITTPGAYPYTTLTTDDVILVDSSAARTIIPLGSPAANYSYTIKDNGGLAATNNITITPSGKNIDGAASVVITQNYGSVDIVYNGTQWNVI